MNCVNCGETLAPGTTICPKCNALNMPFSNNNENNQDLNNNEEKIKQVSEQAPPPTLDVNNESSVADRAGDITDANIETYGEVEKNVEEEGQINKAIQNVNIAIPSVQTTSNSSVESETFDANGIPTINSTELPPTEEVTTTSKKKKLNFSLKISANKKVSQITFLLGLALLFILGLIIGKTFFSKNYCQIANRPTNVGNNTPIVADGNNNTTKVNNFIYKIPDSFNYDKSNSGLIIYNEESSYRIYLKTFIGSYEDIATSKVSIQASLKENEISVNNIKEMSMNEKEHLFIECTSGVNNILIAITEGINNTLFYIEVITSDNNYNYESINVADDIIKNASYTEENNSLEKINVHDMSTLISKIAEENKKLK